MEIEDERLDTEKKEKLLEAEADEEGHRRLMWILKKNPTQEELDIAEWEGIPDDDSDLTEEDFEEGCESEEDPDMLEVLDAIALLPAPPVAPVSKSKTPCTHGDLCRFYKQGTCKFFHPPKPVEVPRGDASTGGGGGGGGGGNGVKKPPGMSKTPCSHGSTCRFYAAGTCKFFHPPKGVGMSKTPCSHGSACRYHKMGTCKFSHPPVA